MQIDVKTFLMEKGRSFGLDIVAGLNGLTKEFNVSDVNRPGLAFAGFYEHFPYERTQIVGISEYVYLERLSEERQCEILNKIFSHPKAVCCILTRNLTPTPPMLKMFSKLNVPLLKTKFPSSSFIGDLTYYLDWKLSTTCKIHGVLTNVYGLGVLILGKSGIGKSECALELIERGHRLISDDVVNVQKRFGRSLVGSGIEVTKHLLEVRGMGIINIKELFGIGAILDTSTIELVVTLESWNESKQYERLGIDEIYHEILDIKVPKVVIPVVSGRNLAIIIETAGLNYRLKKSGCYTAKNFDRAIKNELINKVEND
ncbi:MAG: HPr(Ser) kinase/phosphatase [Elusimicrobiota bacterium]|jgi:HPr kinase/phosphorylase|nr:HPr(Ser) kinase/phosphatase [Elusimicrobiota bacterium]